MLKKILIIFLLGVFAVAALVSCAEDDAPVYVESTEAETTQTEYETSGADTEPEDTFVYQSPVPFDLCGRFMSSTGTPLNLILEYSAQRKEDQSSVSLIFDLFIEHKNIVSKSFSGKLTINGKEYSFVSPFYDYKSTSSTKDHILRIKTSVHCGYEEDLSIDIKAEWDFVGNHGGRKFDGISFEATLPIGEKYANLPSKISYDIKNILQRPELPEGCEVTSLAIVLKDLGFDVSHTHLADNYLEQGQLGKVTPYDMNIGNPREEGKSWGCYSPVIVKTANRYLSDMKSDYTAFDYTG